MDNKNPVYYYEESELGILRVDTPRANLVSNLEDNELKISDEARVAFANDIRDMLQEFIDMGDIDFDDDELDEGEEDEEDAED